MSEPYRVVSALPTGTAFARYLMVKAVAAGDVYTELVLAEKFKDSPTVHATLELQTKAAVSPGLTSDATRAGPLSVYGIAGEALALSGNQAASVPQPDAAFVFRSVVGAARP